jgi:hypothetical protein
MKTLEILLDNNEFEELNIKNSPITLKELEIKLSRVRALKALKHANKIAKETGLNKMTNKEINQLIAEVRDAK